MKRIAVCALVCGFFSLGALGKEPDGAGEPVQMLSWAYDLPVVEGSKTDVGFWKTLFGSTVILLAPGKFSDFWPDYGYSWASLGSAEVCGGLATNPKRANANLGRVRLVTEAPADGRDLVGLELRERTDPAGFLGTGDVAQHGPELSLEELCQWLTDEEAKLQLEAALSWVGRAGSLPKGGVWKEVAYEQPKHYRLVGTGSVVAKDEESVVAGYWATKGDKGVAWNFHKPVTVGDALGVEFELKKGWVFDGAGADDVNYFLTCAPAGTVADTVESCSFGDFEVKVGDDKFEMFGGALEGDVQLKLWSDLEIGLVEMKASYGIPGPVWLVTEYTIPRAEPDPDFRMNPAR